MKKLLLVLAALLGLATPAAAQNPFSLINFGATPVDTNSGNKSAGTLRVVFATDQPSNTNPFLVTGTGGTFPVTGTFWQATQPVSGTVAISNSFLLDATYTGRMPAGASPANGESNTNTALSRIGGYNYVFNGTTWDRWTGAISGTVTANAGSGNFTVAQATGTNLHIVCDSGCSSSTAPADEAAFTFGTTPHSPVGGVFQTTATSNALTTGQMGAFQVTANRALFTNLRNAAGTEVGTSATPLQVTLANTGANATAVKVDGSAVTQPVSGTVTANAGTNLNTSALALDATVTGRLPAGASPADAESNTNTNLSRAGVFNFLFNGTSWDRQRGDTTNGAFVNVKTSVLPTGAALDSSLTTIDTDLKANVTLHAGANIVGKVTTDQTTHGTTDLVAADLTKVGGTAVVADPCLANAHSFFSINQTTTTQILGLAGSAKKYYICSIHLVTATAQNIAVIDSTTAGNACATSPSGSDGFGGSTAATGWNFAANGGIALGAGSNAIGASHNANAALCVAQSGAGQVSGGGSYVVQ